MSLAQACRLSAVALVALLAACQTPKPPPRIQELSFKDLPEIRLDVAEIQVIPAYAPPHTRPYVEHLFHTSPQDALVRWARERIKAVGTSRRAMVVVRRASVIEVPLKIKKGLTGAFTKEPSERYEATVDVELEIRDDRGARLGWINTRVERKRSVMEGITEAERKVFWQELTGQLVSDLAQALERRIEENLAKFRK